MLRPRIANIINQQAAEARKNPGPHPSGAPVAPGTLGQAGQASKIGTIKPVGTYPRPLQRDGTVQKSYHEPRNYPMANYDVGADHTPRVAQNPSMMPYDDPSRFGGWSPMQFPTYGQGPTGNMPQVNRAFSDYQSHKGITQLQPNLYQQSNYSGQPNQFGLQDQNVGPIQSSQLSMTKNIDKKGFTPEEAINVAREGENQLAADNARHAQMAADTVSSARGNVRNLYGQAMNASSAIGQQAYGRIGEDLKNNLSSSQANLDSRGLGNSTITDTVGHLYRREAADSNLGVDQMRAQNAMALDTGLAGQEQQSGDTLASIYGQNAQTDPAAYLLPHSTSAGTTRQPFNWGSLAGPVLGTVGGIFGGPIGAAAGGMAGQTAAQYYQQNPGFNSQTLNQMNDATGDPGYGG